LTEKRHVSNLLKLSKACAVLTSSFYMSQQTAATRPRIKPWWRLLLPLSTYACLGLTSPSH
jgi:hypothetical protein